jgi:hypothetical protein
MAKIIKINESTLRRLIENIVREQQTKDTNTYSKLILCSKIGVKSPGYCERNTKRPVVRCSELGVKTSGYCYADTKKPIP